MSTVFVDFKEEVKKVRPTKKPDRTKKGALSVTEIESLLSRYTNTPVTFEEEQTPMVMVFTETNVYNQEGQSHTFCYSQKISPFVAHLTNARNFQDALSASNLAHTAKNLCKAALILGDTPTVDSVLRALIRSQRMLNISSKRTTAYAQPLILIDPDTGSLQLHTEIEAIPQNLFETDPNLAADILYFLLANKLLTPTMQEKVIAEPTRTVLNGESLSHEPLEEQLMNIALENAIALVG